MVLEGSPPEQRACDELRVYSLDTGAAYLASVCAAKDGTNTSEVQGGRVPVDAVREAAWMTMLAPRVVSNTQTEAERFRIPPGIERGAIDGTDELVELGVEEMSDSGSEPLRWVWIADGNTLASGELRRPDSFRAGESYAAHLWRVAEAPFEQGCVPEAPPRDLPSGESTLVATLQSVRAESCTR